MAVIVVTGASSGIGWAAAVHLAAAGHPVHGAMRDTGKAGRLHDEAAAAGASVREVELDVSDDEHFDRFEQAFSLDIRAGDVRTDEQRAAGG